MEQSHAKHALNPKVKFGVVSRNFVTARHPIRRWVSGCIQSTSFCHRTHFFVFRNEHAQSTTLGPKLMFGAVSRNFVSARHLFRKRVRGCIQSTSFCSRNHFFVFRNKHAHSTTLGPKLMFGLVSRNFVAARHAFRKRVSGCIQSTSFCHRNQFFVFRNEHAHSTILGPKLMFGVASHNFVAPRHPFRKRVSGCMQGTSFATEPFIRFSQRTCPIQYFRSKTHVWGGFAQFRCRTSPIPEKGVGVHTKHEFLQLEPFLRFSQQTCPFHYFRSKTHVWGGLTQFRCRTSPIPKTGVELHTKHEFLPPEPFLRFSQRTCQIHYFRSKTHFGVVSRNFVVACHPFRKRVSGCIQGTSFCHRNHFFVFRNKHAQFNALGSKLMFGLVSRNFVAARHPFRKRVSDCIQSTSFCHRNHFFVFRNEHAQSTTLGPKLMFGVFRAISLPHVTHSENGCRGAYKARVIASGPISSFCATNMLNPLL
jgi:hypothetical protein